MPFRVKTTTQTMPGGRESTVIFLEQEEGARARRSG